MTALESRYATDAQHKLIEGEQFFGFLLVARKAMEDATRQFFLILSEADAPSRSVPCDNESSGELGFDRPLHLFLESLQLLMLELTAPVIIKSYLSDSNQV